MLVLVRIALSISRGWGAEMTVTADERHAGYGLRRWRVHLGLIASFGLALVASIGRSGLTGLTLHVLAGLCFAGLVVVHLAQRRRTLRGLAPDLARPARWRRLRGRLAVSAGVLVFLAGNVIVSGVVDWITGRAVMLPPRAIGIPLPALNWHTTTSLVLVVYLVVHVVRRRARLRHSQIR
jgi:heme exporter protein D